MDNIPPSYDYATARDPWGIIAPYIRSTELCALTRVNKELNHGLAPYLWGNPASHFGTENDRVYVALVRFKRTLKRVRLSVRQLTHTLHLPPAQSEIYDGPRPEWLKEVLEQLPNLQSLVVSQLPFFDHSALLALRTLPSAEKGSAKPHEFVLRLLISAHCQNTTSVGLAEAFRHFPSLVYLDLSRTPAARDRLVLSKIFHLPLLEVLKLRNVNLRDEDMLYLTSAIGARVRSLDVSENNLTDTSVRLLLTKCFIKDVPEHIEEGRQHAVDDTRRDWTSVIAEPDLASLDEFKDASYETGVVRRLTSQVVSRLPFEDLPTSGITHLFIADNAISVEGLAALIRSRRLRVLDAGSPDVTRIINRPRSESLSAKSNGYTPEYLHLPGVEKLVPVLARCANRMTSIRIDHSLVTEAAPVEEDELALPMAELAVEDPPPELEDTALLMPELDTVDSAINEIDSAPPLYELESNEAGTLCELPGDSLHFTVSPAMGKKPELTPQEQASEPRRGSVFAPEIDEGEMEIQTDESPVLTSSGLGAAAQVTNGISRPPSSPLSPLNESPRQSSEMSMALIRRQRQELRNAQVGRLHRLVPGMLPNMRCITLTDVPCYDRTRKTADALIEFIKLCASEAELASLEVHRRPKLARQSSTFDSKKAQHNAIREIFALENIVLEMAQMDQRDVKSSQAPQRHAYRSKFDNRTKSSTEDADSEALWRASEDDFTFFDDEEECGLPAAETSYYSYPSLFTSESEKILSPSSPETPTLSSPPPHLKPSRGVPIVDTVEELTKFRKERKIAYQNAVQGEVMSVPGYWAGGIKVNRGPRLTSISSQRKADYYGNFFEKTGVYR